jgi:hypothetical protein
VRLTHGPVCQMECVFGRVGFARRMAHVATDCFGLRQVTGVQRDVHIMPIIK